ncbi:MAG: tetratricopeptide repeat protein [Anaerolineales bacterium]|nr:MAG: tetratricopeptide repeat protein [Anaerolineales bacterium]
MKKTLRLVLGLWLAAVIAACSALPELPAIPPGWTRTPSLTPTPEATFTPTLIPTPIPAMRAGAGDRALFNGDYDTALLHYSVALQDSPDPSIRASAQWGQARIYYEQERYTETLRELQTLSAEYPQSPQAAQAYFLQGFIYYRLENYSAAADAWQMYLTLRPGYLDAYVNELRGDALFGAKRFAEALDAYTAAIQAPALGDDIHLDLKAASCYTQLGQYNDALALYDGIIARASSDFIKAQATYEAGRVHQNLGQNEAALEKFLFAVENYPLSYYSYLSLVALLDAGGTVSELDRGLVDYFAGQYVVAIAAFDRYLASNPADNDGTAYYYRALSRRNLSFYDEALADYTTFIEGYPNHPRWGDAWGERAFIEWAQKGEYSKAAETLLGFVQAAPNTNLASDYLMSAARIYERDGQNDKATETWARVANEYPGTLNAANAVFLMGVIYYRDGNYASALESFNRSLVLSESSAREQSRALLWLGKSQEKLGNAEAALDAWRDGQNRNSGGYYSERARDLLLERAPFAPSASANYTPDLEAEREDADRWMRLTFNLGDDVDFDTLGPLAADARVIRGREYWDLGLYEKAKLEFEDLRSQLETTQDAVGSYRLTNYLLDIGMYRSAIFAARQTLTIAGLNDHAASMMAPMYFSRIRYGFYFSDLVIPEAQKNGLDPLLVFSVIRQESFFEGFVSSTANARGLMQVIPSTGAQIAGELGKPLNYTEKDLYRPQVSVMFGTYYLQKNRSLFEGDFYAMLAAYNGGAGNTLQWKALAGDDPDLLLESVRFEETRNYIRNIYEIYAVYKRLYGAGEQ